MIGIVFHFRAQPSQYDIKMRKSLNSASASAARSMNKMFGGYEKPKWEDPYALDETDITIRNISLGVGGVLLIVGFVIGSPKSEASETE